jgi:hypothetical protein
MAIISTIIGPNLSSCTHQRNENVAHYRPTKRSERLPHAISQGLPDAHSIGRGPVEFLPGLNIECPVP